MEEQIIQKEQILAELQRVEKELQEKAHAQQQLPAKRDEPIGMEDPGAAPPFSFQLPDQPPPPETGPGIQGMAGLSIPPGRSLANIPPSERPKAKPSRKMIDGKGAKQKSQLQAALQQHSQQLAQLQQLQQQIKQFQQQVEQQLAYTQHAGPVPPPPLPQAPPPGKKAVNGAPASEGSGGGEEEAGASYVELGQGGQEVQTTDLNFLMCGEQLQFDQQGFMAVGPGGVPAGIDPSLLTSAAFELVQDPTLLSSMDPAQIAAAVQHCPIPLDSALQVSAWPAEPGDAPVYQVATTGGQVQLQYATSPSSQHSGAGPITNFGHQLLLPTQFSFGPGTPS